MSSPTPPASRPYQISLSRIKDLPDRRRPREQALDVGLENVSDEILLAILLRSGIPGQSVIDLARRILDLHQGSMDRLAAVTPSDLCAIKGIGPAKALELCAAIELGRRVAGAPRATLPLLVTPSAVTRLLEPDAARLDQEVFWMLPVDQKYRLKRAPVPITRGILNASLVHPREVFREAIRCAAAAILLAHNHPSGDPSPSAEDLEITRQLIKTGHIVDIQVLDHIIIGGHRSLPLPYTSLRDTHLIDFR